MKSQYQGYTVLTETGNTLELLFSFTLSNHFHGLPQDCGNSPSNALELPQSCTKPSTWQIFFPRAQHNHPLVDHYSGLIMSTMASQITSMSTACSIVCTCTHQRKHRSSASLAFVRGIHQWLVDSPHKGPVTWKLFPFDNVIMISDMWDPVILLHDNLNPIHLANR